VSPLIEKSAEIGPTMEEIPTKTVPPSIDTPTSCGSGGSPFWEAVKVTLVGETESDALPDPELSPPPPQPASSAAQTHARRAPQRMRSKTMACSLSDGGPLPDAGSPAVLFVMGEFPKIIP